MSTHFTADSRLSGHLCLPGHPPDQPLVSFDSVDKQGRDHQGQRRWGRTLLRLGRLDLRRGLHFRRWHGPDRSRDWRRAARRAKDAWPRPARSPSSLSSKAGFATRKYHAPGDYFADGITENLTTELSRIRNSFVIARETAFTFKGKGTDAKEIGKELGVRYVLEGSVERNQNRVRVNAQLIDAESGAHLWAERFEEDIAESRRKRKRAPVPKAPTRSI